MSTLINSELLGSLDHLMVKSLRANAKLVQNSLSMAKNLAARRLDLPQAIRVAATTWTEYAQAGLEQASQLVDLQVTLSDNLLARTAGQRPTAASPRPAEPGDAVVDLFAKAAAGETSEVSFVVENNRPKPIAATFALADLRATYGGRELEAQARFEPTAISLIPGEKIRVTLRLEVQETAEPGIYHGTILLHGYPDIQGRLVVEVSAAKPAAASGPSAAAPAKVKAPRNRRRRKKKGK